MTHFSFFLSLWVGIILITVEKAAGFTLPQKFPTQYFASEQCLSDVNDNLSNMTSDKVIRRALIMPVVLGFVLLSGNVAYADQPDIGHGAVLFQKNCAGCHLGGANYVSEKKTLKKEALEKYLSLDQPTIQKFVQTKMPHKFLPFSREFTDTDYYDVTSYVLDQAVENKWN